MNAPAVAADPIVIRASSLTYWPDCERRGAARLFKSIIEGRGFLLRTTPIHVGAPIGTAAHAGAAYGLQTKIDTGELSSLSQAKDVAMVALDEALVRDGETDWKPREAANVDQAQKQVGRKAKRRSAIDGRITRHPGYGVSQRKRKRIEEICGWLKTVPVYANRSFVGLSESE